MFQQLNDISDAALKPAILKENDPNTENNIGTENIENSQISTESNNTDKSNEDSNLSNDEIELQPSILDQISKILQENNNFNYLNCSRFINDEYTHTSLTLFYNEFKFYGATTPKEYELLELIELFLTKEEPTKNE